MSSPLQNKCFWYFILNHKLSGLNTLRCHIILFPNITTTRIQLIYPSFMQNMPHNKLQNLQQMQWTSAINLIFLPKNCIQILLLSWWSCTCIQYVIFYNSQHDIKQQQTNRTFRNSTPVVHCTGYLPHSSITAMIMMMCDAQGYILQLNIPKLPNKAALQHVQICSLQAPSGDLV